MRKIKGFRDIKKHSDLSRLRQEKGLSLSFGLGRSTGFNQPTKNVSESDWDGKTQKHLYKKENGNGNGNSNGAKKEFLFEDKEVFSEIIYSLESEIDDFATFVAEGIPGARRELAKLKEKLERFQKHYEKEFKN